MRVLVGGRGEGMMDCLDVCLDKGRGISYISLDKCRGILGMQYIVYAVEGFMLARLQTPWKIVKPSGHSLL